MESMKLTALLCCSCRQLSVFGGQPEVTQTTNLSVSLLERHNEVVQNVKTDMLGVLIIDQLNLSVKI
jgi:hypothetical protein